MLGIEKIKKAAWGRGFNAIILRHDLFAVILTHVCLPVSGNTGGQDCMRVYECVYVCVCHIYDQRVTFLYVTEHSSLIVCEEYYIWLEKQMTSF